MTADDIPRAELEAREILAQPITLPCGLILPNRLVKCPMQETLAKPPFYNPPVEEFRNLYGQWGAANYGLIITGQVQIDIRFLSIAGDVVVHEKSLEPEHLQKWIEWRKIAQAHGTPTIVQLAHPGRMSPAGAGNRPPSMRALCPSEVPVKLGDSFLDKLALDKVLGTPQAMTIEQIDTVVEDWKRGALVSQAAGFAGIQLHAAHGFLLSQFLSPHTNRRTDSYGGSPTGRLKLLQRLVTEIRSLCPPPFCLSVKLNSGDYMENGGLTQDEALDQVRWLTTCGSVDFVEISGGNAETKNSGLHTSFSKKSLEKVPTKKESTRIREAYFTEFAERVRNIEGKKCPIQLSGGFRSRIGMADAIESGITDLIGLGRTAVLEPSIPKTLLLDPEVKDGDALAMPHIVRGMWFARLIPIKIVGGGLPIQFFYFNMRRLGLGLDCDPDKSIPGILWDGLVEAVGGALRGLGEWVGGWLSWGNRVSEKLE